MLQQLVRRLETHRGLPQRLLVGGREPAHVLVGGAAQDQIVAVEADRPLGQRSVDAERGEEVDRPVAAQELGGHVVDGPGVDHPVASARRPEDRERPVAGLQFEVDAWLRSAEGVDDLAGERGARCVFQPTDHGEAWMEVGGERVPTRVDDQSFQLHAAGIGAFGPLLERSRAHRPAEDIASIFAPPGRLRRLPRRTRTGPCSRAGWSCGELPR
ncbi:hypothetical protein [Actinospongicola halichondriae]|uniref:hypothetical protein n=1 Tax=Actinospongicola halichondriae TaxID=3236844 RepID=UPI003D448060